MRLPARHLGLRAFLLLWFAGLTPAHAQNSGDAGNFEIVSARPAATSSTCA